MQKRIIIFLLIANILYLLGCPPVYGETTLNRPEYEEDIVNEDRAKATGLRSNKDLNLHKEDSRSELFGKWRNNGEALEPKWRDGDAVPFLPFSQFARTYSQKESDLIGDDNSYDVIYRDNLNYRRLDEDRGNHYVDSRQDRPLSLPDNSSMMRLEEKRHGRQFHEKIEQVPVESFAKDKSLRNDRVDSTNYRDTFQVRPNEYEHELTDEEYLKPRPRKRRPPQNEEFVLSAKETLRHDKTKASSTLQSNNKMEEASPKKIEAIKSLLKMQQEEGGSLSEILRRKNLTLTDLLKGKADVISALQMEDIDEIGDDIEQISMAMTSTLVKLPSTTFPSIFDVLSSKLSDIMTTEKTTRIDHPSTKLAQLKETTTGTVATVFPSEISIDLNNSDNNSDQNLNPMQRGIYSDENHDEIMEFSDFTDYKKGRTTASPIWISLVPENNAIVRSIENINTNRTYSDSTLSIIKILNPTIEPFIEKTFKENEPFNKTYTDAINKESNSNLAEDHFDNISEVDYQYDAPSNDMQRDDEAARVFSLMNKNDCKNDSNKDKTIYLEKDKDYSEEFISKSKNDSSFEETIKTFFRNHPNVENVMSERKHYEDIMSEIEPEARAEIFELFTSGSGGKNLERLLKSRNMTLEELIALRQRGSSKVHLAEVSRLRNHKALRISEDNQLSEKKHLNDPEEKSIIPEPQNKTVEIKKLINETEHVNISQIPSRFDKKTTESSFTTEINFKNIKDHSKKEQEEDPHRFIEITELFNTFTSSSFGKDQDQRLSENIKEMLNKKKINDVKSDYAKKMIGNDTEIDVNVVYEGSRNDVKHDDYDENEDRGKSLSKIKPSIIASGAILGVTIVVFLAIFVACRIRHKQKYRYKNSFPRTVFQSPRTTARKLSNTSSLNNIMVNVVATSTTKRTEKNDLQQTSSNDYDPKCDIDNDSLDGNDSWETIPDYIK